MLNLKGGKTFFKRFIFLIGFNLCLGHTLAYMVLKHYDPSVMKGDPLKFLPMASTLHFFSFPAPFCYRVLTPWLVNALSKMFTICSGQISAHLAGVPQPIFLWFIAVNTVWLAMAAACLHFYFRKRFGLSDLQAIVPMMMMWVFFFTVACSLLPFADAGLYFFISLGLMLWSMKKWGLLTLALSVGVFQKEAVLLILGVIISLDMLGEKFEIRKWLHLGASLVIPLCLYLTFRKIFPQSLDTNRQNCTLEVIWWHIRHYNFILSSIKELIVGNFVFIITLCTHAWLRFFAKQQVHFPMRLLLIFPILFVVTFVTFATQARIIGHAFPVYLAYEWVVFSDFWRYFIKEKPLQNEHR